MLFVKIIATSITKDECVYKNFKINKMRFVSVCCLTQICSDTESSTEIEEKMKVRTPHYYKDFKCIAGACTDTCCAGWDVDVDAKAYQYYQSVKGEFGKRLKVCYESR